MENDKNLSSSKKKEQNEILNYSLSSFNLHINKDEFKKDDNFDIFIKDKDQLLSEYNILKKLGEGTFGVVVLAIHKITNEKVAIKILEKEKIIDKTDMNRIKKEIEILKQLRHSNIVHLYNVIETLTHIYLIMEYINGVELFDYIIKNRRIDELESCKFYQQIISGIEYLGKLNIAHRDIKPENLLIDKNKRIKIVDFGLSNNYQKNELLSTACGSPFYAAPEMVRGEKYSGIKIDIWSSGIVLYAMLCGFLPFEDKDNDKLYMKIIEGVFDIPSFLSEDAIDLISHILNVNPKKRYNINDIKKHIWFNKVNPKINMTEGLLLKEYIIPYDENVILYISKKFNIETNKIKIDILLNKFNQMTTTYYLLLNKKIRNNEETIGNMSSNLFLEYIHNEKNLLSSYNYNIKNVINERINKENKVKNDKNINDNYNNYIINNTNPKSIKKHIKILRSSENFNKIRRKLKIENNKGNNNKELLITKININNIIIPKTILDHSEIKSKPKIEGIYKTKLNKSQDIFKEYQKHNFFNNSDIKNETFKSVFNKENNTNLNNNNFLVNKIESININLKKNFRYKSFEDNSNKQKTFINIVNPNNFFLINKNENNIFLNPRTNSNKVSIDHKLYDNKDNTNFNINHNKENYDFNLSVNKENNDHYHYNYTMKNSHMNSPKIKEIFISKNPKKIKQDILKSYKKKKLLSYSFKKSRNFMDNEFDIFSNNLNIIKDGLIIDSQKKRNENNNYIKIMNIPEISDFYSNNFNPKSKLFTYKKIKIPKTSKKLNRSGKTESIDSSKYDEKSSNPISFNNTYDNFNKIQINSTNKKDKNKNCLNSLILYNNKNIEEKDIFFHNPIIEHIYDRNNNHNTISDLGAKTDIIMAKHNNIKNVENKQIKSLYSKSPNTIKDKAIFSNKLKKLYLKSNYNKKEIRRNKFIISNNLTNNSNPKINNINNNLIDNSYNINYNVNNNNSTMYVNNEMFQKKKKRAILLNESITLFKKPKLNDYIRNAHKKYENVNNQIMMKELFLKNNNEIDALKENKTNKKNIQLNYKSIQIMNSNNYNPFDLHSILFYNKENEIKESLIKELNIKRVKYNEKKNKISCFKKDLRFELNIEKIGNNVFVIKFFKKEERNNIYRDLFLNIVDVFNKKTRK